VKSTTHGTGAPEILMKKRSKGQISVESTVKMRLVESLKR